MPGLDGRFLSEFPVFLHLNLYTINLLELFSVVSDNVKADV